MEIITGRTGEPHIYAADDAELYQLFLGDGDFVLQTGNKLALERVGSAVTVHIKDGSLIMQGRLAKIRAADGYDELTLDTCPNGWKRIDLIVAEYSSERIQTEVEREGEVVTVTDFIEKVELKVVKGTESQGIPEEPDMMKGSDREGMTNGDINLGQTHRMKLWAVGLDGINAYGTPTDYRIFIPDATPIQTALDYAVQSVARIQAMMTALTAQVAEYSTDLMDDIYEYADGLREGIAQGFIGRWRQTVTVSDSSSAINVTMAQDYVYSSADAIEVYLEGLRLVSSEYSVTGNDNVLSVTLNSGTFTGQMEVVVYRITEEV